MDSELAACFTNASNNKNTTVWSIHIRSSPGGWSGGRSQIPATTNGHQNRSQTSDDCRLPLASKKQQREIKRLAEWRHLWRKITDGSNCKNNNGCSGGISCLATASCRLLHTCQQQQGHKSGRSGGRSGREISKCEASQIPATIFLLISPRTNYVRRRCAF